MLNILQRFKHVIGEISALRSPGAGRWGFQYSQPYTLDSSRVDYTLARDLYRNIAPGYQLGAAFAKPVINTTAGFVGVPHFTHLDADADQVLDQVMSKWTGKILRINRNALRDGDVFARIVRGPSRFDQKQSFDLVLVPPEWVTPIPDPFTGQWLKLVIRHPVSIVDPVTGRKTGDYTVTEILTPKERVIEVDARAPAEIREKSGVEANPWGFIPVVHFKNESEENQLFGSSELEPIEPFMKAYHDTLLFAVQGSKLFSRPKTKFALRDVQKFLADNFSAEEVASGKIKFADKELFLMQEGDDITFITADSGLAGVTALLEFIFLNIIDASQIPEFAFGTAVASSKASVSEQMVPLARHIKRKRALFEEPYGELAAMFLAMWSKVENRRLGSYQVNVDWDEITPTDDAQVAATIKTLTEGLTLGVEAGLLSHEAASEFLRSYIPSMLPFADESGAQDERGRIAKSMLWRKRIEDVEGWKDDA
ncbi:MAG: hypothetical protein DDT29_00380 [Dehalococcoidia bacterium]|nr:hypothetical protein [Bacillota bacterium]